MKTTLFTLFLFVGLCTFAQQENIKVEKHEELHSVTLYHDNGVVSQVGFVTADKKLHGTWKSYNSKGQKTAMGHYDNGKKVGRWLFWKNQSQDLTQVDFDSNNRITNVFSWKATSELADNDL